MNTNDNMLSNNVIKSNIVNKGFAILDGIFKEKGWSLIKNEMNLISYAKFGDEINSFDIKILPDKICVSIPIRNSSYQYVTDFKSYFQASEYIEQRFLDFIRSEHDN